MQTRSPCHDRLLSAGLLTASFRSSLLTPLLLLLLALPPVLSGCGRPNDRALRRLEEEVVDWRRSSSRVEIIVSQSGRLSGIASQHAARRERSWGLWMRFWEGRRPFLTTPMAACIGSRWPYGRSSEKISLTRMA